MTNIAYFSNAEFSKDEVRNINKVYEDFSRQHEHVSREDHSCAGHFARSNESPLRSDEEPLAKCDDFETEFDDDARSRFGCFENQVYLIKERCDLNASGVKPDFNQTNTRGQYWDSDGNQWLRFCYDTGCTGTVVPKEMVETDSGPIEPLTEGAREFSVANGDQVPDYGRAHMWAQSEQGKTGLVQADVSTVNKPLASGSSLSNNYHSFRRKKMWSPH